MENQSCFDLNAAIECWRQELLAQPSLSSADRSELETHLRDAIAGLRGIGLSEEEAFIIARRRAGPPQQIAEEFFKADPARVWRERIFWGAAVLLIFSVWSGLTSVAELALWEFTPQHGSHNFWHSGMFINLLFCDLPLLCLAVFLSFGLISPEFKRIRSFFNSRTRFIIVAGSTVLTIRSLSVATLCHEYTRLHIINSHALVVQDAAYILWPLALIALVAWLMPGRNRQAPKLA